MPVRPRLVCGFCNIARNAFPSRNLASIVALRRFAQGCRGRAGARGIVTMVGFGKRASGRRSVGVAYGLWAVLGLFGAHRLYLGDTLSAAGIAAITLVSLPLLGSGVGLLGLVASGTWMLADAVLIPGLARAANASAAFA